MTHNIIKLRRGTAAEWSASQPQPDGEVLKLGEPGYEKDTGRLKIGDGVTPWNTLAYFNDGAPIDPEVIQDLLGDGFLVAGTGINIDYDDLGNNLTISTSGVSFDGHQHVSSDITDFNSSTSGLINDAFNTSLVAGTGIDLNYSSNILTINTSGVSFDGHAHISSDITDFNSSVSGLIPVKDIVAGTDISVSSSSGIYTINSSNSVNTDTLEPDGFVNRTDSVISFTDGSRQFTIQPQSPAASYVIYNNGIKITKNSSESINLPNTTALYFIHFDKDDNSLSYKTTGFNFETDIPIAQVYWNADAGKSVYFGEERHGIRMDTSTHKYLHNVFGTQYVNGLSISNYTTGGDGSNNSDATIAIGDGLIYDEDIEVNITNDASPSNPFEQILYPIAQIPVYYKNGSNGAWTDTVANNYPLKVGTTAQYNLLSGGVWSASNSDNPSNNRYIASWICATSQEHAPVITIMGQRIDSSLEQAKSNNAWSDLNLTGLPIVELRPLYRLIYDTKSSFANSAKAFLVDVLDIRGHVDTVSGTTQNDHGSLYGLADDDHLQYVHIDNPRTIDAVHTFSNGLTSTGPITVSGVNVSLEGHTHIASDITDFNSSVSGLLPTIANSGDNRILTSDGTSTGIVAESGLSFDDPQLIITKYSDTPSTAPRILVRKYRGSDISPSGLVNNDVMFAFRAESLDSSGVNTTSARIIIHAEGAPSGNNLYTPSRITLNTSSGPSQIDNNLIMYSDGQIYTDGYIRVVNSDGHAFSGTQTSTLNVASYPGSGLSQSIDYNIYPNPALFGASFGIIPASPTGNFNTSYYGIYNSVFDNIKQNVTNSGAIVGTKINTGRNLNGSGDGSPWYDDNGTLGGIYGLLIDYGHWNTYPTAMPITNTAYGTYIAARSHVGSITNAYDLYISEATGSGTINNHYSIYQASNHPNYFAGNITVDNGLSSPTPIHNLGTVSGNTAINYEIGKQIQSMTLAGGSVNFTEGTGWTTANKSVDVVLHLYVTSTTTVAFDSNFVTDWFSTLPTFSAGTYIILLRSMGSTIVEGFYIGKKL